MKAYFFSLNSGQVKYCKYCSNENADVLVFKIGAKGDQHRQRKL